MAMNDTSEGNIHLAGTEEFLTRLFPVDASIIDTVYETLVANDVYNVDEEEWKDLPKAEKKGSLYDQSLVNTAESIRIAYTPPSVLSCAWIGRHNTTPKTYKEDASTIRPNVLCVLGMGKEEQLEWEALMNDKEKVGGAFCSPSSCSCLPGQATQGNNGLVASRQRSCRNQTR